MENSDVTAGDLLDECTALQESMRPIFAEVKDAARMSAEWMIKMAINVASRNVGEIADKIRIAAYAAKHNLNADSFPSEKDVAASNIDELREIVLAETVSTDIYRHIECMRGKIKEYITGE